MHRISSTIRRPELSRNRLRLAITCLPSLALEQVGLRETSTWLERTTVICAEPESALTSFELILQGPERGSCLEQQPLASRHAPNQSGHKVRETQTVRDSLSRATRLRAASLQAD